MTVDKKSSAVSPQTIQIHQAALCYRDTCLFITALVWRSELGPAGRMAHHDLRILGLLARSSICVTAAFMTSQLHLQIRSNQLLSQSPPTVCGVSSLCQWPVLLQHYYRYDLSHCCPSPLGTSMRRLSTFLSPTVIIWFSNVFKCAEVCGNEYRHGPLSAMVSQRGKCHHRAKAFD